MKSRRHFAIREILSTERISTQEELCEILKDRGYDVTQATVSRDIKELSLIKIPDGTGYSYAWPETQNPKSSNLRMKRVFQDSVVSYNYSENIIVIKTLPGAAQSIASLIDSLANPHILGTVAGDDTIFLVVKTKKSLAQVMEYFQKLVAD
ncbi:MAG: arginine repressor [Firmicutes bacterium HGW-Firmicutes-15]|nr:MAG: arginine repressor [Firmicutes bacterium HGW-Firmicutes-15]